MESFLLDARQTLRALRRERGLVLLAVLSLAMGVGFPTTMFSVVHGATRSLPFAESHELVVVTRTDPARGQDDLGALPWDLERWRATATSFEALEAFRREAVNLAGADLPPERVTSTAVTAGTFALLGVQPALGRAIRAEDTAAGAPPVVVLGDRPWRTRFSADPGVIGRAIRVNGERHTIVGVMPPDFGFPVNSQLWRPLALGRAPAPDAGEPVTVFGRLRDGAPRERAQLEMATVAQRLEREDPGHEGMSARVMPFVDLEMNPAMTPVLYLMTAAVSMVLLIACANVANMLLARASARQRDVAVRSALGASRRRIVARHLVETTAVALTGGAIGVVAAHFGVRYFDMMSASVLEAFWIEFRVDGTVLAFSAALIIVAALAAGLGPALQATRANLAPLLRDAAGGMSGLRMGRLARGLVITELALACALLAVAGAIVRGAVALRSVDMPFDAGAILTAQLAFTDRTTTDADARDRPVREIADRLQAAPGVRAAALMSALPGRGAGNWSFLLDGEPSDRAAQWPLTRITFVSPGFLDVLEAEVQRGRDFGWGDARDAEGVALVNESFVARHSPDRDPIGRRIRLGPADRDRTIVGVVPDLLAGDIDSRTQDGVYLPILQASPATVRALVRTAGPPLGGVPAMRAAIQAVDPDLPVFEVATLHDAIYADKGVLDAFATLFFLFGAGALLLTSAGLYGVVAFGVNQRTREMGVRMALGAARRDILAMVLWQGGRQAALGIAMGLFLALALTRGLASQIEFVRPFDPLVLGVVVVVLLGTAAAATLVPARRAASVTPLEALRGD